MNYLTSLFQAMKSGTRSQKTHAQELPEYVYRPEVDSISFEDGMAALKKFGLKVVDSAIDNTSPSIVLDILFSFYYLKNTGEIDNSVYARFDFTAIRL